MKKIQKKPSNLKKVLIVSLLIVAVVVAGLLFAYTTKKWPFSQTTLQTSPSTNISEPQKNATKDDIPSAEDTPTHTTDQVPVDTSITATINQLSQSNGVITFQATTNSPTPGGKCSLSLTNQNDKPVTRTMDATLNNSVATCGPIQIPEQEFTYIGEWTATLRYYINDSQAVATRSIIIK